MTADAQPRSRQTALDEIRSAEAARRLGLVRAATLPGLAAQWMSDGVNSANVRALAGAQTSGANPTDQVLAELLASIASEQGVVFTSLQEAREVHALSVVSLIGRPDEFAAQVLGLSNTMTDEFSARVRRFFSRRRHRTD